MQALQVLLIPLVAAQELLQLVPEWDIVIFTIIMVTIIVISFISIISITINISIIMVTNLLELLVVLPLQDELVLDDLRPLQGSGVLRLESIEEKSHLWDPTVFYSLNIQLYVCQSCLFVQMFTNI